MKPESNGYRVAVKAAFVALILCQGVCVQCGFCQSDQQLSGLLRRVDGSGEISALTGIDETGAMKFAGNNKLTLSAERVWRFGSDTGALRGAYLLLKDGSRLAASSLSGDAEGFTFVADEFHPALWDGKRVPLSDARAILWKPPLGKKALALCLELQQNVSADTLRLDNGDLVQGEYRGLAMNETTQSEELVFVVRGVESRIALARCVSLRLADRQKANAPEAEDVWTLAFRDGSRVRARKLSFSDRGAAWQTSSGERWEVAAEGFRKNCTLVEPPRRDIVFVSDFSDLAYRHLPTFGNAAPFGRDRNALNEPLRHSGSFFEKGIGMWSNARLSCAVPENAARFQAEICVDESAGDRGSVIFRVLAQMKGEKGAAIKDLYRSELMRGGDDSAQVSVDVRGAANLILLVEAADEGDTLDLANWIDARFVISSKAP